MNTDNSALSLLNCDLRFQLTVRDGYKRSDQVALAKGNAFHFAMEHIARRNASTSEAAAIVQEGCGRYEVFQYMPQIMQAVMQCMALRIPPPVIRPDGTPMVEVKFSEPYQVNGYDLNIQGTIDLIAINTFNGRKALHFLDYKSTSIFKTESLGDKYASGSQLRFYRWAMKKWGHRYLTGEAYELLCQGNYFCNYLIVPLIQGKVPEWSQPIWGNDFDLEESERAIHAQIVNAIRVYEMEGEAPRTGMFHGACHTCDFNILCTQQSRYEFELAKQHLTRATYTPLSFRD